MSDAEKLRKLQEDIRDLIVKFEEDTHFKVDQMNVGRMGVTSNYRITGIWISVSPL